MFPSMFFVLALMTVSVIPSTSVARYSQASNLPNAPGTMVDPARPMQVGGSVKAPKVLFSVDPELTEQARRARVKGNVQVYLWVDEHGNPTHVRVVKGLGMGLDEKAIEAVRQYKFKPAMLDGKPVTVALYIDVNFQTP